jgi:hypothetical protein
MSVFQNPTARVVTQRRDRMLVSKLDAARVPGEINLNDALRKVRRKAGRKKRNRGEGGEKRTAVHIPSLSIGKA